MPRSSMSEVFDESDAPVNRPSRIKKGPSQHD